MSCGGVESSHINDEKSMRARAVLIQVGTCCRPVHVTQFKNLTGSKVKDQASIPSAHSLYYKNMRTFGINTAIFFSSQMELTEAAVEPSDPELSWGNQRRTKSVGPSWCGVGNVGDGAVIARQNLSN